jgi:DNA-binding response OmpR family regulator
MGNTVEPRASLLLVVDDDHKLVPLLERGLRYEGFGVACAYSGTEALSAARSTAPDLVLLDVGMPDVDGFEVLRELRQHSDVPVVMLTAKDEVSDKVGALDLGADDYVAKPFAIDELVARIRAVLRRRGAENRGLTGTPSAGRGVQHIFVVRGKLLSKSLLFDMALAKACTAAGLVDSDLLEVPHHQRLRPRLRARLEIEQHIEDATARSWPREIERHEATKRRLERLLHDLA